MAQRPEPSPAARTAAVALAVVTVLVGLVLLLRDSSVYLGDFQGLGDLPVWGALIALLALAGYLVYRNALRILVRLPFGRLTPRTPQIEVPIELVTACLKNADFACPACSYNLRGLQHPACPECNEPVRLSLVEYNVRPAAVGYWLAMCWLLISMLCAGLTAAGWGIALVRMYSMMAAMGGPSMGWLYTIYAAYVVVGAAAVFMCLLRLALLLGGRTARRSGGSSTWTRSTFITLIAINVAFMVMSGATALMIVLYQ